MSFIILLLLAVCYVFFPETTKSVFKFVLMVVGYIFSLYLLGLILGYLFLTYFIYVFATLFGVTLGAKTCFIASGVFTFFIVWSKK